MSLTEFLRDAFEEGWTVKSTWVKGYNVMMKLESEDETKLIEFCTNDFSGNTPVTLIVRKTTDDAKLLATLEANKKDPKEMKKSGFAARLEAMQKQQELLQQQQRERQQQQRERLRNKR